MTNAAYRPEELLLLRRIFDDVIAAMHPAMQTSTNRALIAARIMDCAATGERDPIELKNAAVADFQFAVSPPVAARYRRIWQRPIGA
jgi:hypothetical protein